MLLAIKNNNENMIKHSSMKYKQRKDNEKIRLRKVIIISGQRLNE